MFGHQILAILFGGKTEKMHHGHRGANHPVKNLNNKNVEITVQNHGFVVSQKKLPNNIKITHKSFFDGTIAGIKIKNKPFFLFNTILKLLQVRKIADIYLKILKN